MHKKLFGYLIISILLFGIAGLANATLIGDTVTAQHYFPSNDTPYGDGDSTVVVDGSSDIMSIPADYSYYTVNVEASSVLINFLGDPNSWTPAPFNGLIVDSLDDSSGNALQNVVIVTNMSGWDLSRLTFDVDTINFNWNYLPFDSSTYFNAYLDFGSQPVPEPSTILLFGGGLAGFIAYRMRKRTEA